MKIALIVTSCAAVFAGWLALTYVREVPRENYPQLGRGSQPITAVAEPSERDAADSLIVLEDEPSDPAIRME